MKSYFCILLGDMGGLWRVCGSVYVGCGVGCCDMCGCWLVGRYGGCGGRWVGMGLWGACKRVEGAYGCGGCRWVWGSEGTVGVWGVVGYVVCIGCVWVHVYGWECIWDPPYKYVPLMHAPLHCIQLLPATAAAGGEPSGSSWPTAGGAPHLEAGSADHGAQLRWQGKGVELTWLHSNNN